MGILAQVEVRIYSGSVLSDPPDVLVLGAGPSGCTAARLLAMWGHAVTLVTRPASLMGAPLAESLTPSCGKFFDLLGIQSAIDDAGFVRSTGNTVWWKPGDARVEMFANGATGWQATSTELEGVMLATAQEAGVRVERAMLTPEEAAARPAPVRLDCTGRAGLLARSRAGRRMEAGHRTVSLSAVWTRPSGWALPDASHTLIESYADGWAWSVPLDETRRAVAVMVDPRITSMTRGDGPAATYRAELEKTGRLRALLAGASMIGGPTGWDASMYSSTNYAGDDWLVVGDAASFVDPLSSAGVKKALASGWLAAIVTHTALSNPGMAATARQFFADREAEVYANFLSLTRGYLHEAAEGQAHPFWSERAEAREREAVQVAAARERQAVSEAFERLKAVPELTARRGAEVRLERRPAIGSREIVMEPRLITPTDSVGVRYLYDVDVVAMVELAPTCRQVPDLFDAYVKRAGPVDLGGFLTALATAVTRRWVDLC